jgi:hypothetical protein
MYSKYIKPPNESKREMHIPGYNYCGPGTQVFERVKRGDNGVNYLDNACKLHDIEYMAYIDNTEKIIESDKKLIEAASKVLQKNFNNTGILGKIISPVAILLEKFGLKTPFDLRNLNYLHPSYIRENMAAKLVKSVFESKEGLTAFLKMFGYKDFAKDFTMALSTESPEIEREKGNEMLKKITSNTNIIQN